jgi:hypothetical protein
MKQMKQIEVNLMRLLAGACCLFTILALAPMAAAQHAVPAKANQISPIAPAATAPAATSQAASPTTKTGLAAKAAAKPVEEEETAAPNSPDHQGIKVHGHWVLQVKNIDGTLGERREFDNSLITAGGSISGDQIIAALLSGNVSAGDPAVGLISSPYPVSDPTQVCVGIAFVRGANCSMITTNSSSYFVWGGVQLGLTGTVYFSNYTVPTGFSSFTAVETMMSFCVNTTANFVSGGTSMVGSNSDRGSNIPPSACDQNDSPNNVVLGSLTYAAIPGGTLNVIPGQIIQITVTITFS